MLTELHVRVNQFVNRHRGEGGRVDDLGWRRSLSLGWDIDFGYRMNNLV